MWHSKQRIKGDNILDCHINTPCTNCGKLIRKSRTGLCVSCYNKSQQINFRYCTVCFKHIRNNSSTGLCLEHYKQKISPQKKTHNKQTRCKNCGKQIRHAGLCSTCRYLEAAKKQSDIIKKRAENTFKPNTHAEKMSKNYNPSPCLKSPSGYHRWFINGQNIGTCFYCDTTEKMPELKQQIRRTYVDVER